MIREALADAGPRLADVDGMLLLRDRHRHRRVPRHPPELRRRHVRGRIELRAARRARGGRHRGRAVRRGGGRLHVHAASGPPARASAARRAARWDRTPRPSGSARTGTQLPMTRYALAASRHMAQYGTTAEQLARIAVDARRWAAMNPRARYRDPITVDDVLASPVVASPLHQLDCCLVTDGAGAYVLTSAERARDLAQPGRLRARCRATHRPLDDLADARPHRHAGRGVGTRGVRDRGHRHRGRRRAEALRLVHDHRAAPPRGPRLLREGRGRRVRRRRRTGPGGSLPTNTNGGGLSYTHPGQYGMFLLVEAVRQLRGECGERQVAGAEVAVAHGCRRLAVGDEHGRARHGGDVVTTRLRATGRRRERPCSGTRRARADASCCRGAPSARHRSGTRDWCAPGASVRRSSGATTRGDGHGVRRERPLGAGAGSRRGGRSVRRGARRPRRRVPHDEQRGWLRARGRGGGDARRRSRGSPCPTAVTCRCSGRTRPDPALLTCRSPTSPRRCPCC